MKRISSLLTLIVAAQCIAVLPAMAQSNPCDLATPYGTIDSADVTAAINMALGVTACTANISGSGVCNIGVVQRVINASLPGGSCVTGYGAVPHAVTINWTASTSPSVSGYNVYRGTTSGGPYTKVNTALVTTVAYTDNTASAGKTYYYVTTAVDTSGMESGYSNEAVASVPTP